MPFQKGQSGNPTGRKKALGLSRVVRKSEGLKVWARLLDIYHAKVREQVVDQKTGDVYDVVPSIKEQREAVKLILGSCWGTPTQQGQDELERRVMELEERLEKELGRRLQ